MNRLFDQSFAGIIAFAFFMSGCGELMFKDEPLTANPSSFVKWDTERLLKTVCDPFDDPALTRETNGLFAKLFYLNPDQPQYSSVADYFEFGQAPDIDLYFSKVDVPTRLFSAGFETEAGGLLVKSDETVLHEWFALKYESNIKLTEEDEEGRYQFAILADDGAILRINDGSGLREIVNNDGLHPSRLECATETIHFDANTVLPMDYAYYQGPRYHISTIILWRKIPEGMTQEEEATYMNDTECGVQGNNHWFDYQELPPTPKAPWTNLLSRGWNVVQTDNYVLPSDVEPNRCDEDWDIIGYNCYTENYTHTAQTSFVLFMDDIDPEKIRVHVNGIIYSADMWEYDASTNTVTITAPLPAMVNNIRLDYCQLEQQCQGLGCGGGNIGI